MRYQGVRHHFPRISTRAGMAAVVAIAVLGSLASTPAWAEAATAEDASQFSTSVLPPNFMSAAQTGLKGIFGACGTIRLENMVDPDTGEITALDAVPAVVLQEQCPAAGGKAPDESDLSCTDYSKAKFDVLALQVEESIKGMQCRERKMRAIESEIACLNQQTSLLSQKIGSVQQAYVQNIQKMQKDVQQLKSTEKDIEAQIGKVNERLRGNEETGKPGLLSLKEKTLKMINELPNDVQVIEEEQRQIARQRESLEEQAQFRTMALTMECFKDRKVAKYRATPNGPPVSAYEYVLARYYQNQHLVGDRGKIEDSETVRANALKAKQALEAVLQEMIGGAPDSSKMPTTLEEVQATMNRAISVEDMDDVEDYTAKLAQFNGKGLDIQKFVLSSLKNCNNRAAKTVSREKKRENSILGKNSKEILKLERETAKKAGQFHTRYMEQIRENMRGLNADGPVPPLDFPQCAGFAKLQPHESRKPCFDAIRNGLTELMKGATDWSRVPMTIQGTNPQTAERFTCQGLDGCINALQRLSDQRKVQHASVVNYKNQYILSANQNVQGFTKKVAATMSSESQVLHARIQALNTAMASMGLSGGVTPSPLRTETLEKDEDGLYKTPQNALALIGSQMTPPMLDLSREPFQDALAGLSDGKNDLNKEIGAFRKARSLIASLTKSCPLEKIRERMADFDSNLNVESCLQYQQFCAGGGSGSLQSLIESVQRWDLETNDVDLGSMPNVEALLGSGMQCASRTYTVDELRKLASEGTGTDQRQYTAMLNEATSCERINRARASKAQRIGNELERLNSGADDAL